MLSKQQRRVLGFSKQIWWALSGSSLPILAKDEPFPRVIGNFVLFVATIK
jgi:hypothetical protein